MPLRVTDRETESQLVEGFPVALLPPTTPSLALHLPLKRPCLHRGLFLVGMGLAACFPGLSHSQVTALTPSVSHQGARKLLQPGLPFLGLRTRCQAAQGQVDGECLSSVQLQLDTPPCLVTSP